MDAQKIAQIALGISILSIIVVIGVVIYLIVQYNNISKRVTNLENANTQLNTRIDKNTLDIGTLQQSIVTIERDISQLTDRIVILESEDQENLTREINVLTTHVNILRNTSKILDLKLENLTNI